MRKSLIIGIALTALSLAGCEQKASTGDNAADNGVSAAPGPDGPPINAADPAGPPINAADPDGPPINATDPDGPPINNTDPVPPANKTDPK